MQPVEISVEEGSETFGEMLQELRRMRAMSQEHVSHLVSCVTVAWLSRVERGSLLPQHVNTVDEIALALGCTIREKRRLRGAYRRDLLKRHGLDE